MNQWQITLQVNKFIMKKANLYFESNNVRHASKTYCKSEPQM